MPHASSGGLLQSINPNMYGMLDSIVCSRAKVFAGTYFSTFTGYIHRLRGYTRTHTYTYICTHTHTYIYTHTHTYTSTHIYTYTHTHARVPLLCMYVCMYVHGVVNKEFIRADYAGTTVWARRPSTTPPGTSCSRSSRSLWGTASRGNLPLSYSHTYIHTYIHTCFIYCDGCQGVEGGLDR